MKLLDKIISEERYATKIIYKSKYNGLYSARNRLYRINIKIGGSTSNHIRVINTDSNAILFDSSPSDRKTVEGDMKEHIARMEQLLTNIEDTQ